MESSSSKQITVFNGGGGGQLLGDSDESGYAFDMRDGNAGNVDAKQIKQCMNDIKRYSGGTSADMSRVVKHMDLEKQKMKFTEKMKGILEHIVRVENEDDDTFLKTVFLFVMQSCEDYLSIPSHLLKDKENIKKEVCIGLLLGFVGGNGVLAGQIYHLLLPLVKTSVWHKLCVNIGKIF